MLSSQQGLRSSILLSSRFGTVLLHTIPAAAVAVLVACSSSTDPGPPGGGGGQTDIDMEFIIDDLSEGDPIPSLAVEPFFRRININGGIGGEEPLCGLSAELGDSGTQLTVTVAVLPSEGCDPPVPAYAYTVILTDVARGTYGLTIIHDFGAEQETIYDDEVFVE